MKSTKNRSSWLWAYLFIAPTVIGLYIFYLYPMAVSLFYSFTKWNPLIKPEFIGLANYQRLFTEPAVLRELFNTFFFVITLVPLTVVFSLILANALNRASKFNGFYRTVFFLPYITLPVATAQVWRIMFNSRFGLINALLKIMNLPQPLWFENEWLIRFVIILSSLWGSIGYYSVIILAGLQNIPAQYYEACELEGGGGGHKFI
jgi:multiple sugar transport system permease protein